MKCLQRLFTLFLTALMVTMLLPGDAFAAFESPSEIESQLIELLEKEDLKNLVTVDDCTFLGHSIRDLNVETAKALMEQNEYEVNMGQTGFEVNDEGDLVPEDGVRYYGRKGGDYPQSGITSIIEGDSEQGYVTAFSIGNANPHQKVIDEHIYDIPDPGEEMTLLASRLDTVASMSCAVEAVGELTRQFRQIFCVRSQE